MKFYHLLFVALMSTNSFAAEPLSFRDRIAQFLDANVMGRTQQVLTQGTMDVDGKKYLVDFEATIQRSGLTKTPEGLFFVEKREIKQKNTPVNDQGAATADSTTNDRTVIHRYSVSERQTTRSLVGLSTMTENSSEDPTGQGNIVMIEISDDDKELYIYESMAGFEERTLDGINIQPIALATSATLYLNNDGKLITDETVKFYKVDINKDFAREELNRFNISAVELTP